MVKKANQQLTATGRPGSFIKDPVGIGLRPEHHADIPAQKPDIGWLEIHPENYFGGGKNRHCLRESARLYPMSFHAVGLSLGADQPVDTNHLEQIAQLIEEFKPFQFSDHASWSASGNAHLNDLLPLPYTQECLDRIAANVDTVQQRLGFPMLVENPSTYISYNINEMREYEFMNALSDQTGCWLLLDINNIYVQCVNHNFDPYEYIDNIKREAVAEMHLAGHSAHETRNGETVLIDTHNNYVRDEVWALYDHAVKRIGPVPTLIEWDQDMPELSELVAEAARARGIIRRHWPLVTEHAGKEVADAAE